jgi:predicted TIM-barrel fold metal-dependent hydrolase
VAELGSGFVGVAQLRPDIADEEIRALDAAGIRAVRFNIQRGGREQLKELEPFAHRVRDVAGWHVELYVDVKDLGVGVDRIAALPAVSIDHLGLSRERGRLLSRHAACILPLKR